MSYTIKDHTPAFDQQTTQKASIFLRTMAETIVNIAQPRTPMDKGNLRRDVVKSVLGLSGKIKWGKNYAAIQETKQHKRYTTAGTGPHYARNAVNEGVKQTDSIARRVGLI